MFICVIQIIHFQVCVSNPMCVLVSAFLCVCSLDRLGARQFFIQTSVLAPSTRNGMQWVDLSSAMKK